MKQMGKKGKRSQNPSSSNKDSQNANGLLDKLTESVFVQIVTFLVGTGLIGGCAYLLLQAKQEDLHFERELLQFSSSTTEDKFAVEMAEGWKSGNAYSAGQLQKLQSVVRRLSESVEAKKVDDQFVRENGAWLSESSAKAADEMGKVGGFTFTEELYRNLQQDYIREYETEKKLFSEVSDLVSDWDMLSIAERRKRFGGVAERSIGVLTPLAQIQSRSGQIIEKLLVKKKENEQRYKELHNLITTTTRKKLLARTGIVAGALLVSGLLLIYLLKFNKRFGKGGS
jgi:hypothetical protein